MSKVILAANPLTGHVIPVLNVARDLVRRGHEVVVYTGSRFEQRALGVGARFRSLPPRADYDDRDLNASFPARAAVPPGPEQLGFDLAELFVGIVPAALRGLEELLAEFPADVVIAEQSFFATIPLAKRARGDRPVIVTIGFAIPGFLSDEVAPPGFGMLPLAGQEGRVRNRELNARFRAAIAPVQRRTEEVFASLGVEMRDYVFNAAARATDHYLQLTVPGFEYARSDFPDYFRFAGPLPPEPADGFDPPAWWSELGQGRPVVVVTQGTLATADLGDLVIPALRALADLDVLVVAATVREDGPDTVRAAMGEVPANARLGTFIPFDQLLPHASVFITNGGSGGVHVALHHGVPLVVAGVSEDKPEIAARAAWSGTGIDLHTGKPAEAAIRAAVEAVLTDPAYRSNAERLSREFTEYRPFDIIAEIVENT